MAATGKNEATCPVINNVRNMDVQRQDLTHHGPTAGRSSQPSGQTTNSTCQPVYNGEIPLQNTHIAPQRPQDLIDNLHLDLARVNVKSSAQYRKSYAFKIWRDKGIFPYRLAEKLAVKDVGERKKSKKYLNAIRAKNDRKNEEEWREYKSCRTTNDDMKYKRTSKFLRVQTEDNLMNHYEKEQLNTILSDSQDTDLKARSVKHHQNSIPDYFKNKKESAQKSQPLLSPNKSIPTPVIHVITSKPCEVSKPPTQAEPSSVTTNDIIYNGNHFKFTAQAGVRLISKQTSEGKLLNGNQEDYSSFSQWSSAQTSSQTSSGNYNIQQTLEPTNANTVNSLRQLPTETMTAYSSHTNSGLGRITVPEVLPSLISNPNGLASNSKKGDEDRNKDTERLSIEIEHNGKAVSDQPLTPSLTPETSVHSEIDNSKLASIIKRSLTKKYSKENVKPTGERGRKRARNESVGGAEEGASQRARAKQEKSTMFTRLDEGVATNLADGIHNVNSEYFPIEALANKAAKETSKGVSDEQESTAVQTSSIKHKLNEIERARLLLKELFDVTSESGSDNEMKTFDVASRSFGRKNILNHLSLIDRYFDEFQKKLSSTE